MDKNVVQYILQLIFAEISQLIATLDLTIIDLGVLGRFKIQNKKVTLLPLDTVKKTESTGNNKLTVRGLMDLEKQTPLSVKKLNPKLAKRPMSDQKSERLNESQHFPADTQSKFYY